MIDKPKYTWVHPVGFALTTDIVRCNVCGCVIVEAAPTRMRVVCVACTGIDFAALEDTIGLGE